MTMNGGFFIPDPYAYSYASADRLEYPAICFPTLLSFFQTVLAILGPLRLGHLAHLCKGIAGLFVHWRGWSPGPCTQARQVPHH